LYKHIEYGPPSGINSAAKNREELNNLLRTSHVKPNADLIVKEHQSYKVLLKAIEPTDGETSPRKDV
jgi:hypothetical protein